MGRLESRLVELVIQPPVQVPDPRIPSTQLDPPADGVPLSRAPIHPAADGRVVERAVPHLVGQRPREPLHIGLREHHTPAVGLHDEFDVDVSVARVLHAALVRLTGFHPVPVRPGVRAPGLLQVASEIPCHLRGTLQKEGVVRRVLQNQIGPPKSQILVVRQDPVGVALPSRSRGSVRAHPGLHLEPIALLLGKNPLLDQPEIRPCLILVATLQILTMQRHLDELCHGVENHPIVDRVVQRAHSPGLNAELVPGLWLPVRLDGKAHDPRNLLADRIGPVVRELPAGDVSNAHPVVTDHLGHVHGIHGLVGLVDVGDPVLFGRNLGRSPVVQGHGTDSRNRVSVRVPGRYAVAVVVAHVGHHPVEMLDDLVQPGDISGHMVHLDVGVEVVAFSPRQRGRTGALGVGLAPIHRAVEAREALDQRLLVVSRGLAQRFPDPDGRHGPHTDQDRCSEPETPCHHPITPLAASPPPSIAVHHLARHADYTSPRSARHSSNIASEFSQGQCARVEGTAESTSPLGPKVSKASRTAWRTPSGVPSPM